MREILFRGKDVKGLWHIGLIAHIGNAWYISNKAGIATAYEVIPATIGQLTGLTDKNGKKIFEGDIIRHHNDHPDSEIKEIGVVFWDEKYCGWRRTSNGKFHHGVIDTYRLSPDCVYEVIGNIHDNPELLKGEKT